MAASRINSSWRICRRYRIFFYFCFIALAVQLFLGFSFYSMNSQELKKVDTRNNEIVKYVEAHHTGHPVPLGSNLKYDGNIIVAATIGTKVESKANCSNVAAREAASAISRASSAVCKQEIFDTACLSEQNRLYPAKLPRFCHVKGKESHGTYLGCFKDNQKDRDMPSFSKQFTVDNTPEKCINFCLTGGYKYAGVQYKVECWCDNSYGKYGDLPETSCGANCPGNQNITCGGYNAQRIFSTGLPEKIKNKAELVFDPNSVKALIPVRIVFVLTVNGRAVRQVLRLINSLYKQEHYFFIHVDKRSTYMYRELLPLEKKLPNVRLSRERFSTIWGGASLLQAHLSFMAELLEMTDWHWDYYINLSECDYPIKNVELLTMFLTKHRGNNFLKSNGRATPTFIQKQGLNWLFHECDNHLWRIGKRELPEGIRFDGGSDWMGLYRDFVEYSIRSTDQLITGLKEFYRYTLLPVESFFHVLLLNSRFCGSGIDNNLHLTNWKRKQGCKCQHKNQVDWCGCSPNVFKTVDFDRLLTYKGRVAFFGRKFEPVINQDIINSVDSMMTKDNTDLPAMTYYWHNIYHYLDPPSKMTQLYSSYFHSLVRRNLQALGSVTSSCAISNILIIESHVLYVADHFHRLLIKYNVTMSGIKQPVTLESQFSFKQHYNVLDPLGPIGSLQSLEVGTDFDVKELIFRNYARFLGPDSDIGLRHEWGYGLDTSLTVAWIDPAGIVAAYEDLTLDKNARIALLKPKLKHPLRPGVWTVKLLYKLKVCVEVQFIVLPYVTNEEGGDLAVNDVVKLHNGPGGLYSSSNYSDFTEKLAINNQKQLLKDSVINGQRVGKDLDAWVDELSSFSWNIQDTCSARNLPKSCLPLNVCSDSKWSSLSPDPKCDLSRHVPSYI